MNFITIGHVRFKDLTYLTFLGLGFLSPKTNSVERFQGFQSLSGLISH